MVCCRGAAGTRILGLKSKRGGLEIEVVDGGAGLEINVEGERGIRYTRNRFSNK